MTTGVSPSTADLLQSLRRDYKLGSSVASTKADIRQSMKTIINNKIVANAIERDGSSAKLNFYKDVQKKSANFFGSATSGAPAHSEVRIKARPTSQHPGAQQQHIKTTQQNLPMRPMTAKPGELKAHFFGSTTKMSHDESQESFSKPTTVKARNPNLVSHFDRTISLHREAEASENCKSLPPRKVVRIQSAYNIRKIEHSTRAASSKAIGRHVDVPARVEEIEEPISNDDAVAVAAADKPELLNTIQEQRLGQHKRRSILQRPGTAVGQLKVLDINKESFTIHAQVASGKIMVRSSSRTMSPTNRKSSSPSRKRQRQETDPDEEDEYEANPEPNGSRTPAEEKALKAYFNRNPLGCMEDRIMELEKYEGLLGMASSTAKEEKERLHREQLRMLNMKEFTGEYENFEPMMPWERVSLYLPDEPNFNDSKNPQAFKREPILKVSEKDEKEIADLMEDVKERFEFFKKHTEVHFDTELKFLKNDPSTLTMLEADKIKAEYSSKRTG